MIIHVLNHYLGLLKLVPQWCKQNFLMTHMTPRGVAKTTQDLSYLDEQKHRKTNMDGQRASRLGSDEETTW